MSTQLAENILASRRRLLPLAPPLERAPDAAEGGCGVLGFAASLPVAGRHVLTASAQMHNRGNGKGGGIAMAGLDARQAGVDAATLRSHTLLQVALLDTQARREVEQSFILPHFEVAQAYELPRRDDYREIPGLEVRPPDVWRYFVRAKASVLEAFASEQGLGELSSRAVEEEFVYQNSFRLNSALYASLGEKRAFVLSHGRDLSVLKIVGYAEDVVAYYRLEEQTAHVWIAHQRYPTKGRVWHPGGAHPFIGLNEALVHNGDFANYHAVGEYLRQRGIGQLFLTDTEVSVQLFDLWDRVYGYPLEMTLEAMAPTTEHDFLMLPEAKKAVYQAVQRTHIHGSPDGPWFFIVARTQPGEGGDDLRYELLGITDTSMLRPQVFALYENDDAQSGEKVQIGLIASERQAINACLRSLSAEDERFQTMADRTWVARGGSHTDGGAFRFAYTPGEGLVCSNKFGQAMEVAADKEHLRRSQVDAKRAGADFSQTWERHALHAFDDGGARPFWNWLQPRMAELSWDELAWALDWLVNFGQNGADEWKFVLETLHALRDRRYANGKKKRASVLGLVERASGAFFARAAWCGDQTAGSDALPHRRLSWERRHALCPPPASTRLAADGHQPVLIFDAAGFPAEGSQSAARWLVKAQEMGWQQMAAYNWRGGRFAGAGLGPNSQGTRLDLYGDMGDYAGSGLDGGEVHLHGDGQDQVGQILKSGRLVIHGDVGQTFLYGAKGGEVFVLGSAAGRPLINAVGKPRTVINGTCLDYLAESFMAGDPLNGGGFVILNGVRFDEDGCLTELETPYPGGNLFSLASGGAIFLRDPRGQVTEGQLNGGAFAALSAADWALIEPYLIENERLFGIEVEKLLTVDGERRAPEAVYRKVEVRASGVLREGENR